MPRDDASTVAVCDTGGPDGTPTAPEYSAETFVTVSPDLGVRAPQGDTVRLTAARRAGPRRPPHPRTLPISAMNPVGLLSNPRISSLRRHAPVASLVNSAMVAAVASATPAKSSASSRR